MDRYEVVKSLKWQHTSGNYASFYGATPWGMNIAEKENWSIVTLGYTIRDNKNNTIGNGKPPVSENEAIDLCEKLNS